MKNPFEELKTAEDYNNFFLALVGDATGKGIELHINCDGDTFECIAYHDDILEAIKFI